MSPCGVPSCVHRVVHRVFVMCEGSCVVGDYPQDNCISSIAAVVYARHVTNVRIRLPFVANTQRQCVDNRPPQLSQVEFCQAGAVSPGWDPIALCSHSGAVKVKFK